MTYRLYNRVASAGFAIECVLTVAGIPFELIEIDSAAGTPMPESFRQTNPWGQVPTLILPDGQTLTETAAILIYLASNHDHPITGPNPSHRDFAKFIRWIIFASVNVHEAASRRAYPDRFSTNDVDYTGLHAAATERFRQGLETIDQAIAPERWLVGDTLTSADIYFAMMYAWFYDGVNAPHLDAIEKTLAQHDVIAPIWRRHLKKRYGDQS